MKVLHVPYCWRPDPFGGTEHYVLGLWRALHSIGVEGVVAATGSARAPIVPNEPTALPIHVPMPTAIEFRRELYGEGSVSMASRLVEIALENRADLVHFHSSTRLASLSAARLLRDSGIPYLYTFHTPTSVCLRGDLRLEGGDACDGEMQAFRCTRCWLGSRGVPRPLSDLLATTKLPIVAGRGATISGARRLTESRILAARGFLQGAAAVVALCSWGEEVLRRNGVAQERIVLSRHGLDDDLLAAASGLNRIPAKGPPTFVFLGRADWLKGADVLVDAVRSLPDLDLRVVLFLVVQSEKDQSLVRSLRARASGDSRIRFETEAPRLQLLSALAGSTACVVPSRWMETGPLVVLESFAVGTPVVGSRFGGIAELVQDGHDGLLFDLEDRVGLARAIERLVIDPGLRARLRRGVSKPRGMGAVAREMESLYSQILKVQE